MNAGCYLFNSISNFDELHLISMKFIKILLLNRLLELYNELYITVISSIYTAIYHSAQSIIASMTQYQTSQSVSPSTVDSYRLLLLL